MGKKQKKMRGKVEKIIKPSHPGQKEKAQIDIKEADDLYREIRVDNVLTDERGKEARLDAGDEVDVTVETEKDSKKKRSD